MLEKFFNQIKSESPYLPNKYTTALGKLIRTARLETKMSQAELAERAHLKQSSISRIEDGTRAVSTEEILYLSYALDKPISYFFPKEFTYELAEDELSVLEKELLMQARQLSKDDLRKLIVQSRALAEYRKPANETEIDKESGEHLVGGSNKRRRKKK